jgi:Ca2+-binding EF-hand superfamily protein
MDEFRIAMHKALGSHLTKDELDKMFMKVDTNCDGTVDWDEYLSYMLLEYREKDAMNFLKQPKPFPLLPSVVPNISR